MKPIYLILTCILTVIIFVSCSKDDTRCWECEIKHMIYNKTETYCQEDKPTFDDPYIISVKCEKK